jgi:DNA-binding MarR family transcriptional regulator
MESAAHKSSNAKVTKPKLDRMRLLYGLTRGFRSVLDDELAPFGLTLAQMRVLWMIELNPEANGAEMARICEVTPQSVHAILAGLQKRELITRRHTEASERVLVSEVTERGREVLTQAKVMAETLDKKLWADFSEQELAAADAVLGQALERLGKS